MPNRNYTFGRDAEYAIVRDLTRLGFDARRTAGSHGPYDVMGVSATEIVLVQSKRGQHPPSPADYKSLVQMAAPPLALKLVLYYPEGVGAVRSQAARILWASGPVPEWASQVRWLMGPEPRQKALRLSL